MNAFDLDTPAVYVDLDALERNIRKMQEQSSMQLEAGATGITVAKIGEAQVSPGDDVLVAYPIMADKLSRLRALAA